MASTSKTTEIEPGKLTVVCGPMYAGKTSHLIENFENYIDPKDPTNNCLDLAIITAPEKRTKKTIDKLKTIAGRVLKK